MRRGLVLKLREPSGGQSGEVHKGRRLGLRAGKSPLRVSASLRTLE